MNFARLLLTLLLAVPVVLSPPAQAAVLEEGCDGFACQPDFIVYPAPGWLISMTHSSAGKGLEPSAPCEICQPCRAAVTWNVTSSGQFTVTWAGGAAEGLGVGHGTLRASTHCDSIPMNIVFYDTTSGGVVGHLYCDCS